MADYSQMNLQQLLELREKKRQELEQLRATSAAGPMQGPTLVDQPQPSFVEQQGPAPVEESVAPGDAETASPYRGMSIEELEQQKQEKMQQLEDMGALTFAERVERQRDAASEAFERGDYLEGLGTYATTVGLGDLLSPRKAARLIGGESQPGDSPVMSEGSLMALEDLLSNVATQGGEALETAGEWISSPLEKAGAAYEEVKKMPLLQMALRPGYAAEVIGTPVAEEAERIIDDPAKYAREQFIDAASFALPGGGARKLGQIALRTATGKAITKPIAYASAFLSRKGQLTRKIIEETTEKRFENPANYEAMRRMQRDGEAGATELVERAQEGLAKMDTDATSVFHKNLDAIQKANPGQKLDPLQLHETIDAAALEVGVDLKALRAGDQSGAFRNFTGSRADEKHILKAMDQVDEFLTDPKIEGSLINVHILKRKLANTRDFEVPAGAKRTQGQIAIDAMWGATRKSLDRRPDGRPWNASKDGVDYKELTEKFEKDYDVIDDITKSIAANQQPETVARKLIQAFRDDTILGTRRRFMDQLQEASGQPIKEMVAGLNSSSWVPQGTGAFTGLLTSLGLGGGGVRSIPVAVAVLPFSSPKIMGSIARAAGWGERAAKNIENFATQMNNYGGVLSKAEKTGTVGVVLSRMAEAQRKRKENNPDILTNLGRTGQRYTGQSTQVMQ